MASPPYGITAGLLGLLLAPGSRLVAADLVLQRAVVRKQASRRAGGFQVTMGASVPRRALNPPPRVDSAVLIVRRRLPNHDDVTLPWSGAPRCDIAVVLVGPSGPAAAGVIG